MRLTLLALALALAAGCTPSTADTIKLSDGRTLTIPPTGDVGAWAAANVAKADLPLVVQACRNTQMPTERIMKLCQLAEHHNAINSL